jgi:hypothetical protein
MLLKALADAGVKLQLDEASVRLSASDARPHPLPAPSTSHHPWAVRQLWAFDEVGVDCNVDFMGNTSMWTVPGAPHREFATISGHTSVGSILCVGSLLLVVSRTSAPYLSICSSAAGHLGPIAIVYPAKNIDDGRVQESLRQLTSALCKPGSPFAALPPFTYGRKSGFFNTETFTDYIRRCVPEMRRGVPDHKAVLLMVDGAKHHIAPEFWLELKERKVELLVFPPNLTKYWMPSDARPWHGVFNRVLRRELLFRGGATGKHDWMHVIGDVIARTMTPAHAKAAFRHVGMVVDKRARDAAARPILDSLAARAAAAGDLSRLIDQHPDSAGVLRLDVIDIVTARREKERKKASNKYPLCADMTGWVTSKNNTSRLRRILDAARKAAEQKAQLAAAPKRRRRRSAVGPQQVHAPPPAQPKGVQRGVAPRVGKKTPRRVRKSSPSPPVPTPPASRLKDEFVYY